MDTDEDCECAICFEIILSCEAEGVRLFNCTHRVHAWCAQKLVSSAHGSKCPYCRAPPIAGSIGDVRQQRTGQGLEDGSNFHPVVSFENLATRNKVQFIKKAFVHASADNIKLADLVESINSFFVYEKMEVITKLVLLHELYAMAYCVCVIDNAFVEIRVPNPHVVFLDTEAVEYVAAWEKRKHKAAEERRKNREQAAMMVSEESRLNREHYAELERRVAELRAAARVPAIQNGQDSKSCSKQTQCSKNTSSTSLKATDANVPKKVLSPAEEFSLLCGRVCTPLAASSDQIGKRLRSSTASIVAVNAPASCNNGIRAPVRPEPKAELELVSNVSSTESSSSSSSSSSDSDSSSSSSDRHRQTNGSKRKQPPHAGRVIVAKHRCNVRKKTLEEQVNIAFAWN